MKVEIGESLVSSYLNHVEQCRIIQTNWKVSGNWGIGIQDKAKSQELFEKIIKSSRFKTIFKANSFEQLIKQAEIDVLGVNTLESSVYAYDIAFHSKGLNYSGNIGTCETVMKKIFRAIFSTQIYFPEFNNIESCFLTPKANNKLDSMLDDYFEEAKELIGNDNITIKYISNEKFFEEIVDPVIELVSNESDTSELYVRAIKLNQLDSRNKHKLISKSNTSNDKRKINEMKIGQYVKNCMFNLSKEKKLNEDEILNLQNIDYCRSKFNVAYPILIDKILSKKDSKGNNRYYKDEIVKGYWLCSQWVESHWDSFLKWENSKK
ncbi:hypothetical protein N8699_00630 [Flavobacteriaceae bacterium]|nr:hypothetical protein [Flavobacteriaceae bacterium]